MIKVLIISVVLSVISIVSYSQEEFVDPPSRELTKIHFTQLTGGVIIFKTLLDDFKDSLSFILDTGSGGISLDSSTVAKLGMTPSGPSQIIRGIGGTRKVGFIKNSRLNINGLTIDSLNFHVVDYDVLSSLYGEKIDGVAGYSILSRFIVKINYENSEIVFCSTGTIKYPKSGFLMRPRLSKLPYLSAEAYDASRHRLNYLFDLGAGITVLFSDDYINDSTLLKSKRKKYLKQGEGLGGKVDFYLTVIKELKLGPYKFRNVPINIFEDEYNVTMYPASGAIIGNDIFRRFNCILNYKNREIHLKPNKFLTEPFDYAYSGIQLYLIDGKPIIGDIPKGAPADKAGLLPGDEVLAVNKKFGMTLNDLKVALQSTYGSAEVLIRRNTEMMNKKLNVINIMNGKSIPNQTIIHNFREGFILKK